MKRLLALLLVGAASTLLAATNSAVTASKVRFDKEGVALLDGQPFFPIGLFTYELNSEVLAEIHELQCNTILNGFTTDQLDLIHEHGLMAVCSTDSEWLRIAKGHPALLAWYLTDEPENRGLTPAAERRRYLDLKSQDPDHPIGLCHTSFEALSQYKQACDFTMTDIYPITAARDKDLMGVSIMMDEARRIHGPNWPQWTYLQVFGGSETDNGVWAVPLPHEVRFMAYQALVHRATGLLYFSYWPQQPRTWQSVAQLNREIQRLVPRLVAPGKEFNAQADSAAIQVRGRMLSNTAPDSAKKTEGRTPVRASGLVIAINTSPRFVQCTIRLDQTPPELILPFEGRTVVPASEFLERFGPYAVHVYTWGPEPTVRLARQGS